MSELIRNTFENRIEALIKSKLLPADIEADGLTDLISKFDEYRKSSKRLKKIEVAFGEDAYRLIDPRLELDLGNINPKDLTSYLGFVKPKMNTGAFKLKEEESDEEEN